jgi:hypothetical protein
MNRALRCPLAMSSKQHGLHVKEPEGGNIVRFRSDIELTLFPQVNLIAPYVVRPQVIEPLLSVTAKIFDGVQIWSPHHARRRRPPCQRLRSCRDIRELHSTFFLWFLAEFRRYRGPKRAVLVSFTPFLHRGSIYRHFGRKIAHDLSSPSL